MIELGGTEFICHVVSNIQGYNCGPACVFKISNPVFLYVITFIADIYGIS